MKKLFLCLLICLAPVPALHASDVKKLVKTEAKSIKKDGYKTFDGEPSLECQLERMFQMKDAAAGGKAGRQFVFGYGEGNAVKQDLAMRQAISWAKVDLSTQCRNNIAAKSSQSEKNIQAGAESLSNSEFNNQVEAHNRYAVTDPQIVLRLYRNEPNGTVTVKITYAAEITDVITE